MAYHSTKSKMDKNNPNDKIKKNLQTLKEHPKLDKNGKHYSKKHISLMRKFIKKGMTFNQAHLNALKEEKKEKSK
jgi:hypothetical protein